MSGKALSMLRCSLQLGTLPHLQTDTAVYSEKHFDVNRQGCVAIRKHEPHSTGKLCLLYYEGEVLEHSSCSTPRKKTAS